MSHEAEARARYEEEARGRKAVRDERAANLAENAYFLDDGEQIHASHSTGRETGAPDDAARDLIGGDEIKHVYELLPNWTRDQLRRLKIVPGPGTQLAADNAYIDLHDLGAGELRARGDELIHTSNQLLVSKKDTDYEVWDRLTRGDV